MSMAARMSSEPLDCVIIGGGPAGLTVALYLARYNRRFVLIDGGNSRAAWIPESHNLPLFTKGIAGPEILRRQREHVEAYGASIIDAKVTKLEADGSGFTVRLQADAQTYKISARFIVLATGVVDIAPQFRTCKRLSSAGWSAIARYAMDTRLRGERSGLSVSATGGWGKLFSWPAPIPPMSRFSPFMNRSS